MYYDLHIHSCLSPCAEEEMTPNNIVNMAVLKGLDLIAVTDHNSTRQVPSVACCAKRAGLHMLYGCELETMEEVHVLGLFGSLSKNQAFQEWIDAHLPITLNNPEYFGTEKILNEEDQVVGIEERLLIVSLNCSLEETVAAIHQYQGKAILAHVLDRKNSVITQLGFIPMDLAYDGLEVKDEQQKQEILKTHPWIQADQTIWLMDSDAHRLIDISEAEHEMEEAQYNLLRGDQTE